MSLRSGRRQKKKGETLLRDEREEKRRQIKRERRNQW
jgi:hypothetical protein